MLIHCEILHVPHNSSAVVVHAKFHHDLYQIYVIKTFVEILLGYSMVSETGPMRIDSAK